MNAQMQLPMLLCFACRNDESWLINHELYFYIKTNYVLVRDGGISSWLRLGHSCL